MVQNWIKLYFCHNLCFGIYCTTKCWQKAEKISILITSFITRDNYQAYFHNEIWWNLPGFFAVPGFYNLILPFSGYKVMLFIKLHCKQALLFSTTGHLGISGYLMVFDTRKTMLGGSGCSNAVSTHVKLTNVCQDWCQISIMIV